MACTHVQHAHAYTTGHHAHTQDDDVGVITIEEHHVYVTGYVASATSCSFYDGAGRLQGAACGNMRTRQLPARPALDQLEFACTLAWQSVFEIADAWAHIRYMHEMASAVLTAAHPFYL